MAAKLQSLVDDISDPKPGHPSESTSGACGADGEQRGQWGGPAEGRATSRKSIPRGRGRGCDDGLALNARPTLLARATAISHALAAQDFMKTHLFNAAELATKIHHPGLII